MEISDRALSPSDSTSPEIADLLAEIDALRAKLLARRRQTPYPWDPSPLQAYNELLARARSALPTPPAELPLPADSAPTGRSLWRTPLDQALDALESLRAALITAHEQRQP